MKMDLEANIKDVIFFTFGLWSTCFNKFLPLVLLFEHLNRDAKTMPRDNTTSMICFSQVAHMYQID